MADEERIEGTGPVAEDQEAQAPEGMEGIADHQAQTMAAAQSAAAAAEASGAVADDAAVPAGAPSDYATPDQPYDWETIDEADWHDDAGAGIDWAVVTVVLAIIVGCLGWTLYNTIMNPPSMKASSTAAETMTIPEEEERVYEVVELPEGVAAVVNGVEIPEQEVTDYIVNIRTSYGLESEDQWAQWLVFNGLSPDQARQNTIEMLAQRSLFEQEAAARGIEATQDEADAIFEEQRAMFGSEEEWQQALDQAGLTEESFREQCLDIALQKDLGYQLSLEMFTEEDRNLLGYLRASYPEYANIESVDEVPADIVAEANAAIDDYAAQSALSQFIEERYPDADVKISKMPSDVSYQVFILPYYFDMMMEQAQADNGSSATN